VKKVLFILTIFFSLDSTILYGGITGKINGSVKNQNGQQLAGVNVIL